MILSTMASATVSGSSMGLRNLSGTSRPVVSGVRTQLGQTQRVRTLEALCSVTSSAARPSWKLRVAAFVHA